MADTAEILTELRDLRVPEPTGLGPLADTAAAFSLGLAAALVVALLLRAVASRPPSRRQAALAELAQTRRLAPAERLMAQATILKRVAAELGTDGGGEWPAALDRQLGSDFFSAGPGVGLRQCIYRRDTSSVDPDLIEREVARLLRRMRG